MPRTSTLLLVTGDFAERLDALYETVQDSERDSDSGARRIGETSRNAELREAYEALKTEAEDSAIKVTLQAVGRKEWRTLREKHPPRTEGDAELVKQDRLAGVNVDTVEDDLVYASLLEPKFENRAQYEEWADALSEGEFQAVLGRAWTLASVARMDPKSLPALQTPSNGGNSESRVAGA
jgi:hypothetical protein